MAKRHSSSFDIHHIFPLATYRNNDFNDALNKAGYYAQAKGNKIPLFSYSEMADIVREQIKKGSGFFKDLGFWWLRSSGDRDRIKP